MSLKDDIEREFKFDVSESALAQRVWVEGGVPETLTAAEQAEAQKVYFRALLKAILRLADAVDGLQVGEGDA